MIPSNNTDLEGRLWNAADELRASSKLRSAGYSTPVLGLIFLKDADHKFAHATQELQAGDREIEPLEEKRDALQCQMQGLTQRLLTGRVGVRV